MNDNTQTTSSTSGCCPKVAQLRALIDEIAQLLPNHQSTPCAAKGSCAAGESGCQLKAAADAAMTLAGEARDTAIIGGKKAIGLVRQYPVQATAIAVGTGLLVWWLATRGNNEG